MNEIENSNPLIVLSFPSLIPLLGRTATSMYEIIRNKAHQSKNNKCKINQTFIHKGTNIIPQNQSKLLNTLETWKLVITNRNEYKGIIEYEVPEINFQLLLFCPQKYKDSVEEGTMVYFCDLLNFSSFTDSGLIEKIISNSCVNNAFDIDIIRQNIKDTPHKSITPTSKLNRRNTNTFVGANRKNIKETKVSLPSSIDEDSTFAKNAKVGSNLRASLQGGFKQQEIKPTAKRKSIDKFYNGRSFNLVKKHWNSLSGNKGLKKISDLKEKQNLTLDTSILAVQALLSGRLLKFDITLPNRRNREFYPPENLTQEKIDLHWLLEKITKFHKLVTDPNIQPVNKDFIKKYTLGDFILGVRIEPRGSEVFIVPSFLFNQCCQDFKTVWEDPHPDLTRKIGKDFNLYTEQNKDFSSEDLKLFSKLGDRIVDFSKKPDALRSHIMGKGKPMKISGRFFVAQEQEWRGRILEHTPAYFAGDHAWGVFQKRLEY